MKIQVFDPPMCCSTGVCGPSVDPALVRFAADLDWLKRQGVQVERFGLSQDPAGFVSTPAVKEALAREGNDCLPLTLVDGAVAFKGQYPSRQAMAKLANLDPDFEIKPAAGGCCCSPRPAGGAVRVTKASKGCC